MAQRRAYWAEAGGTKGLRVCLYLEADEALAKSGFKRAFEHQHKALRLRGIPVTTDPLDEPYDVLHIHACLPRSFYYLQWAKRRGARVVVHAHTVGAHDFRDSYTMSNLLAPLYEDYLKLFFSAADYIFTPTEFAKSCLLRSGVTRPIGVVSNGVDRERFAFSPMVRAKYRARYRLNRFTVFGAGNLMPRKGIMSFLAVAERLPGLDFIWYGHRWSKLIMFHPEMYERIDQRSANVRMPGFVTDAPGAYSAADTLFFPSLTETQGLVILEAASLGLPIVVRDLAEYRGWLTDGVNCLKATSDYAFEAGLRRLASDSALRRRLSRGSLALAEAHDLNVIGQRLVQLYNRVLRLPRRTLPKKAPKGRRGH